MFFLNQRKTIVLSCLVLSCLTNFYVIKYCSLWKIMMKLIKLIKLTLVSLSTTIRFKSIFIGALNQFIIGNEMSFKLPASQMFGLKLNKMSIFHSLEVVVRGSETHLQVGDFFLPSALRDECSYGPFQVWIYSLLGDVSFTTNMLGDIFDHTLLYSHFFLSSHGTYCLPQDTCNPFTAK